MMYKFFPHTEEEVREMLHRIGVQTLDDLYAEVPESIRFKGDYELPESMSEIEVRQLFRQLGDTSGFRRSGHKSVFHPLATYP